MCPIIGAPPGGITPPLFSRGGAPPRAPKLLFSAAGPQRGGPHRAGIFFCPGLKNLWENICPASHRGNLVARGRFFRRGKTPRTKGEPPECSRKPLAGGPWGRPNLPGQNKTLLFKPRPASFKPQNPAFRPLAMAFPGPPLKSPGLTPGFVIPGAQNGEFSGIPSMVQGIV